MYEMSLESNTWTLTYSEFNINFRIASWTLKEGKSPALGAVLKAQRCFQEWNNYCGFAYIEQIPFKTYFPSGPELEAEVHNFYEILNTPAPTGDDTF